MLPPELRIAMEPTPISTNTPNNSARYLFSEPVKVTSRLSFIYKNRPSLYGRSFNTGHDPGGRDHRVFDTTR